MHGVEGLYVVDASVMPNIPSGNLNGECASVTRSVVLTSCLRERSRIAAPTQMIAMKGADIIRGVAQMLAERPHYEGCD